MHLCERPYYDTRFVYVIGNKVTGRKYVGSSQNPKYRMGQHFEWLKIGKHSVELFQEDYNTYGVDSFETRVVGEYSFDEARRMESFLMKILKSQNSAYGYNYKDKSGTSKYAIKYRWRIAPRFWRPLTKKEKQELGI